MEYKLNKKMSRKRITDNKMIALVKYIMRYFGEQMKSKDIKKQNSGQTLLLFTSKMTSQSEILVKLCLLVKYI